MGLFPNNLTKLARLFKGSLRSLAGCFRLLLALGDFMRPRTLIEVISTMVIPVVVIVFLASFLRLLLHGLLRVRQFIFLGEFLHQNFSLSLDPSLIASFVSFLELI